MNMLKKYLFWFSFIFFLQSMPSFLQNIKNGVNNGITKGIHIFKTYPKTRNTILVLLVYNLTLDTLRFLNLSIKDYEQERLRQYTLRNISKAYWEPIKYMFNYKDWDLTPDRRIYYYNATIFFTSKNPLLYIIKRFIKS